MIDKFEAYTAPAAENPDGFDELRRLLAEHQRLYPLMDIQDAAKLLYQHELGPAHILRDVGGLYTSLKDEYASLRQLEIPLLQDIGGGYARVELRALEANGVSIAEVFDWLCKTIAMPGGSMERFIESLKLLSEPEFGFDPERLKDFFAYYKNSGYAPIHHSARYVAQYSPAYRVIKAELASGREII